jgi:template-activating factor I
MSSTKSEPPPKKQRMQDNDETNSVLRKLNSVQEKIEQISNESAQEIIEVEKKYNLKRMPIYLERNQLIKQIPEFWKTAFLNHSALSDILTKDDASVLSYLEELQVEESIEQNHFISFNFKFRSNPWFHNETISKRYIFEEDVGSRMESTEILWKEGKDLTQKKFDQGLFSYWFQPSQENMEADEIADIIREEIWANPLKFYLYPQQDDDEDDENEDENSENDDEEDEENNE